jgi:uncharacterized protein YukE
MAMPFDPDALRIIEAADTIQRQLSDAAQRLRHASARANGLADQTDWRTDAATRFHASADSWRHDVAALAHLVEGAGDEVSRARLRVESLAWIPAG